MCRSEGSVGQPVFVQRPRGQDYSPPLVFSTLIVSTTSNPPVETSGRTGPDFSSTLNRRSRDTTLSLLDLESEPRLPVGVR